MTDKNSSSHHHQHHHHCCPKQLQRQQAGNQQQPTSQRESASSTAQASCNETTTTTGKKNDHHQTAIKSVSSKQCPSHSSLHPHRSDLDNNTLTTTAATEVASVTRNPNGAQMRNVFSSSAAMVEGQNQQHVITNSRSSSTTSTSSIVAANQHLNNLLNTPTNLISVTVAPFTGGPFTLTVNKRDSVEELKKAVAKKLKVLKDRICLLYRESQLSEGSLDENSVVDGSRITLLPRAETGLLAQKPEQSVMQALESLNDSQVVDFLSGKAPLNLTMRLGDHMMLIQLQLSTVNASTGSKRSRASSTASAKAPHNTTGSTTTNSSPPPNLPPCCSNKPPVSSPSTHSSNASSRSHVSSDALSAHMSVNNPPFVNSGDPSTSGINSNHLRMSKSANVSHNVESTSSLKGSSSSSSGRPQSSSSHSAQGSLNGNVKSGYKPKLDTRALAEASKNLTQTLKQLSSEVLTTKSEEERPRKRARTNGSNLNGGSGERSSNGNRTNGTKADNERQGSSSSSGNSSSKTGGKGAGGGGAIIESMHHHGKGVYSGTFSGTLNPALQDRNGQPKRDITTIIHILNDLLCAQYKNYSPGAPTENATATPSTNQTSAPHQTTSTTQSSKTSRSSESQKPVNITKSTKSGSNSCGSSNDKLEGIHQSLLQKPTLTAAREKQSRLTEKTGNDVEVPLTSIKDTVMLQDQVKVTKDKMEHLKRIMEERKAKRRARREARAAPYSTSWSLKSSDTTDTDDREETIDRDSNNTVEMQVDTSSPSSSDASTNAGGSSNSNGQNTSASQAGAGGNPSDIFNPELEPVTA